MVTMIEVSLTQEMGKAGTEDDEASQHKEWRAQTKRGTKVPTARPTAWTLQRPPPHGLRQARRERNALIPGVPLELRGSPLCYRAVTAGGSE